MALSDSQRKAIFARTAQRRSSAKGGSVGKVVTGVVTTVGGAALGGYLMRHTRSILGVGAGAAVFGGIAGLTAVQSMAIADALRAKYKEKYGNMSQQNYNILKKAKARGKLSVLEYDKKLQGR